MSNERKYETPHTDALVASGVPFTRATAQEFMLRDLFAYHVRYDIPIRPGTPLHARYGSIG